MHFKPQIFSFQGCPTKKRKFEGFGLPSPAYYTILVQIAWCTTKTTATNTQLLVRI